MELAFSEWWDRRLNHAVPQQCKHPERGDYMGISLKQKECFLVGSCEVPSTQLDLEKAGADNTVAHN